MPTNFGFTSNRVLNDDTTTQIIVEEVFDDPPCLTINEREGPQITVEEVTERMALTSSDTRLLTGGRTRQRRHSDDLQQASTVSDKPLRKGKRPKSQNKTSRRKRRK